jgi:hypothetical protein
VMRAAQAIGSEGGEQPVGTGRVDDEHGMPGERDDGFEAGPPRRHPLPAPVCVREPAGRSGGDQPGQGMFSRHATYGTGGAGRSAVPECRDRAARVGSAPLTAGDRVAQVGSASLTAGDRGGVTGAIGGWMSLRVTAT